MQEDTAGLRDAVLQIRELLHQAMIWLRGLPPADTDEKKYFGCGK